MLIRVVLASQLYSLAFGYTGDPLVANGIGTLMGYPGMVYQAVKYIPVCGSSGPTQTSPSRKDQSVIPQ